jgi:hypothetical protein
MVEYSLLTWVLILALVLLFTVKVPVTLTPGAPPAHESLITAFLRGYQGYFDSLYFVLNLPFP